MDRIHDGIRSFQARVFPEHREHFEALRGGQQPQVLFITCADSRIDPALVTQTDPGEVFVLRNAGNFVPPWNGDGGAEAATIEYALSVLGIPDVVVCGHSHCGAMQAVLDPDSAEALPAVRQWIEHGRPALDRIPESGPFGDPLLDAVAANVRVQIDHLKTHPSVASGLGEERVRLHGWLYRFETGEIFEVDERTRARALGAEARRHHAGSRRVAEVVQ